MPDYPGDEWITVAEAARMLGLRNNTVRRLVERGELEAELGTITALRRDGRLVERRQYRLRRREVEAFIRRALVKPGELQSLFPPLERAPDAMIAAIRQRCQEHVPANSRRPATLTATVLGNKVTIWEQAPRGDRARVARRRRSVAQLRYDPASGGWLLFAPVGHDRWEAYAREAGPTDIDAAMTAVLTDPHAVFFT